jgi:outer membrane protein
MKNIYFLLVLLFLTSGIMADGGAAQPLTFNECYKIAVENSDAVKIQSEKLKQANAEKFKAAGNMLPSISLTHTRDYGIGSGPGNTGDFGTEGWESQLIAKQPVFYGFEKINALSVYDREAYKEELNLISVKRGLEQNTASAFYALASAQADMINLQDSQSLMLERVKQLRQWQELGKSRPSEVYATESTSAQLTSQIEQAKAQVEGAADALSRVLGVDYQVSVVQPAESPDDTVNINITYTAENRSDVLAQKAEVEASDKRIGEGLGTGLPQVDLSVSKLLGGTPYLGTTSYKDTGWQFILFAQLPLFEGGSRVFDSVSAFSQREAAYRQYISTLKDVKYELKSRLRDYSTSAKIVAAMKDAYAKTSQSLKAQQADYNYGLVTNVDVLKAMSDSTTVKQSMDRAIVQRELDKKLLEISAEGVK